MKKTIIIFSLVAVVLLFGLGGGGGVSAQQDTFTLKKGWNLVSFFVLNGIVGAPSLERFFEQGNALFVLNPVDKQYYGGTGSIEEINKEFEKYLYDDVDDDLLPALGFWIYSKERTQVPLQPLSLSDQRDLREMYILYKGWNFIGINSFMEGLSFAEIKGDCEIEPVYHFEQNQWFKQTDSDLRENFTVDSVGHSLAVKVSDNCQFDFSGGSNIPPPPVLPN